MTGTIKHVNTDKGFGFITGEDGDVFFHASRCVTPFELLAKGQRVTFDVSPSDRGPRAERIERA